MKEDDGVSREFDRPHAECMVPAFSTVTTGISNKVLKEKFHFKIYTPE